MAWDQGYPQDFYYQDNQYVDPSYYDYYGGYGYCEYPVEDTESEKLRKDQAEKERIEALESNRLYLKKVKKQCVKEDFVDLQNQQLFLFEVLIESLEVQNKKELGLVSPAEDATIKVRAQFLNSPYLEISESSSEQNDFDTEPSDMEYKYMQAVNEAGLNFSVYTTNPEQNEPQEEEEEGEENKYDTKWAHSSGKSCLFSMTALEIIQDLERFPVNLQVCRCVEEKFEPIGYSHVRLPDQFSLSVLQSGRPGVVLPVSTIHRESCDVFNLFGVKKGRMEIFVRLSCFGPAIITSFKTEGADRRYLFKPSPMETRGQEPSKSKELRADILRPIFAEEDRAVGITVLKEHDLFQRPVLWKLGSNNCGCLGNKEVQMDNKMHSRKSSDTFSLNRLPLSGTASLCKDVVSPKDTTKLKKFGDPLCDWHNVVALNVKNGPIVNCGCITSYIEKQKSNVSRILKATGGAKTSEYIPKGIGMIPEPTDCGCDCPVIRENLKKKNLLFS